MQCFDRRSVGGLSFLPSVCLSSRASCRCTSHWGQIFKSVSPQRRWNWAKNGLRERVESGKKALEDETKQWFLLSVIPCSKSYSTSCLKNNVLFCLFYLSGGLNENEVDWGEDISVEQK